MVTQICCVIKKPWYQGKYPNLAVKIGFQGDGIIFAEKYGCQNNNSKFVNNSANFAAIWNLRPVLECPDILDMFFTKFVKFAQFLGFMLGFFWALCHQNYDDFERFGNFKCQRFQNGTQCRKTKARFEFPKECRYI